MILVPFNHDHISRIAPQDAQANDPGGVVTGPAWTAMQDGEPLACFGYELLWAGRGYAWALLGRDAARYMLPLTRAIRSLLSAQGLARFEMAVSADFEAGCRWAEMLGFRRENEQPARAYFPDGRAAWLYARV